MHEGDCVHFNGIQHDKCDAGVNYRKLANDVVGFGAHLPCLPRSSLRKLPLAECAQFCAMTKAQDEAREAEVKAAIDKAMAAIAAGKCHVCGAEAEPSKVIGRCRYAACGHRVGQVDTGEED